MAKKNNLITDNEHVWLVAYIDAKCLKNLEKELKRYPEYKEVEAYIPTVKILKKTFKKENFFEEVPLLFNYGFFKVPRKYAVYKDYLDQMQKNISCLYGWVRDAANTINEKPTLRVDGKSVHDKRKVGKLDNKNKTVQMIEEQDKFAFATASSKDIARLIKDSVGIGAHDKSEIEMLAKGSMITLRGYPFEGFQAEVVEVEHKTKKVKVKIHIINEMREVKVSFDNVFFTIYHSSNHDDSLSGDTSIDEMGRKKTFDKLQFKNSQNAD